MTPKALAKIPAPSEWIVTRTIRETYGAVGRTRQEAIAWVNERSPEADTVTILTESAKKVRSSNDQDHGGHRP
jgi:hypothetical protein